MSDTSVSSVYYLLAVHHTVAAHIHLYGHIYGKSHYRICLYLIKECNITVYVFCGDLLIFLWVASTRDSSVSHIAY